VRTVRTVSTVPLYDAPVSDFFQIAARNSTVAREVRGGVATFLAMAYILFANPAILAAAGVPREAALAATALTAAITSILMGVTANMPLAMAPGMGLNAVIAFQVAGQTGSWQAAMGLVVVEGLLVLALVLAGVREAVMTAIPVDLRRAIGVGIGLFIAFIGAVNARLIVIPGGTIAGLARDPGSILPPVGPGTLSNPGTALALAGLLVAAVLLARRQPGALLISMAVTTTGALAAGVTEWPQGPWVGVPRFDTIGAADLSAALAWSSVPIVLSLMMVDFFDTLGTATAIAEEAHLTDRAGHVPHLKRLLAVDALGASIGGWFGASSSTAYIESAAGVAEGARTGLHSVVVGVLFACSAFLAPLAGVVPAAATAPALIAVGFLMCTAIARVDFTRIETGLPAFLTILLVPLTYSIAHGIGYGLLAYVAIAVCRGRARHVHPVMYAVAVAFAAYFVSE
jgi:AGZA family xanthine/uracil permease-like MFS transporter